MLENGFTPLPPGKRTPSLAPGHPNAVGFSRKQGVVPHPQMLERLGDLRR